jgi:hypothetical protein
MMDYLQRLITEIASQPTVQLFLGYWPLWVGLAVVLITAALIMGEKRKP